MTILAALDAYVELYNGGIIPIKDFAAANPDNDILVRVIIKKDGRKVSYQTHRMTETDFGVLTCAVACKEGQYTVVLGARPHKAVVIDNVQLLNPKDEGEVDLFIDQVVEQVTFGSNMRGSAEYRQALAKVLIRRAINEINA